MGDRGQRTEDGCPSSVVRRPLWRRLVYWTLVTVGGLILFLGLIWAGLQTRWAKNRLAGFVESATADAGDYRVTLRGLDGLIPFSIIVDRIVISDADGSWLEANRVNISLKAEALLAGVVDVKWFRMEHLSVSRLPQSTKRPSEKKKKSDQQSETLSLPNVMVREIYVKRIDLGEQVAGAPMAYALQARAETAGRFIDLQASLQDLDHEDDGFDLAISYDLESERISSDMTYHESPGGLAAGLLGIEAAQGIHLSLKADGSLSEVEGRLNLDAGGYGNADFNYRVGLNKAITLAVDGQVRAASRIVPNDVVAALGSLTLDMTCSALLSPQRLLQVKAFTAKSGSAAISMEGSVDLGKQEMDMLALVAGVDVSPFLKGGLALHDLGETRLTAKGPLMQPNVTAATTVGGFKAHGAALEKMVIEAGAKFERGFSGLESAFVGLTAQEAQCTQSPGLKGPLRLDITAKSPNFTAWNIKGFHLRAPEIDARVDRAAIDTMTGNFSAELRAQVDHLAALLPPQEPRIGGRMVMHLLADGNYRTRQITADMDVAFTCLSGLPSLAAGTIGTALTLIARATMKDDILKLETAHLKGGDADLKAEGWLNMGKNTFDVEYDLSVKRLASMADALGTHLVGTVESQGRFAGGFQDFSADIRLSSKQLQVSDLPVKEMQTRLEGRGLPRASAGSIRMKGTAMDQPVRIDADFVWSGETLSISHASANLPGIELKADLTITPAKNHVSGTALGKVKSLELLRALTGVDAEGSGGFRLKAGRLGQEMGVAFDANFKHLRYLDYGASIVQVKGRVDDLMTVRGQVSMEATDVVVRNRQLQTLKIGAKGSLKEAAITLEVRDTSEGAAHMPISLMSTLSVQRTDLWRFRIEALRAAYKELDVTLQHPATITMGGQGIVLDDLQLETKEGRLHMAAKLDPENVEASVRLTDLPLALLEPFVGRDLSGVAVASLNVSGPLADPALDVRVHIREFEILGRDGKRPLLIEVNLDSKRDGDRFATNLKLSGLDRAPFTANGSIPAHISLKPFAIDIDKSGELTGKLRGRLNLAVLQRLPAMIGQTLGGNVDVDIGVGGSLEKWDLNGGMTISEGHYENAEQGVILANISGRLEGKGRTLQLIRLTATDGSSGTVSLEGGVTTEAPFPANAGLTLKQATLLRKDIFTSTVSGRITIKGDMERMDLTGEILLDRTEVVIPRRFPPDVIVIPVKEINVPPGMPAQEKPGAGVNSLHMDLVVRIPDRFFVRGRGLDCEFKGKLKVQGSAKNPTIRGTLHVVRGTFQFLSRTFNITSGQIAFDGATPPVPFLDITTEVNAGEIAAQVRITGPADAFKLTLTSQPPRPQDEIMAQILFGESVAKLNTFQALQLASSLSQIAGGYGPDVIGGTRNFLGLDRLGFSSGDVDDDDSGPSVEFGKYVSDKVYVGIEQDLTNAEQDVIVEVDITPSITVEGKAGTKSGAGIGINWNYDY